MKNFDGEDVPEHWKFARGTMLDYYRQVINAQRWRNYLVITYKDLYEVYDSVDFDVPIGATGDTFDRYLVRILEMRESIKIIQQCIRDIPDGYVRTKAPFYLRAPEGDAYSAVEGPKGELGFYLVSDQGIAPYRCKVRAPSFINCSALRDMVVGWKMGDLITIFGSMDIVMGEVDR